MKHLLLDGKRGRLPSMFVNKIIRVKRRVDLEAGNQRLHCEEALFYSFDFVTYKTQENLVPASLGCKD